MYKKTKKRAFGNMGSISERALNRRSLTPSPRNCTCLYNLQCGSYTRFFVRKIGYINFVPKSVSGPSVRLCVCPSVRPSVTFLVIASSPKPLDVANLKLCRCIDHMRVLGDISCELDPKVKVKGQIMSFLVSPLKLLEVASSNLQGHVMLRVLGDVLCDLDPKVKVKGQIMYFLVNESPQKLLETATSNFACA